LLFVGRVVPQKDILALLEIFAHVHASRPDLVLVIAGSPALSRKYEQQIQQMIDKRGIRSRVLFTGQVNNGRALAQLFEQAKFLVVTSEWESFCVPLVEAMHFGVPPVVHQIDPLPEVGGEAAVVVDKHQPEKVAEKIVALLDDEGAYATLQTAARARAVHFTDQSLAEAMLALFKDGIWQR
jgi:glycosyltransferase involved in cell wall biosynthesis